MNMKAIEKLMNMLPEGPKKEALRQKLNSFTTNSTKRGGDGLQDSFELQPKGHIMIEEIDSKGNVVGVLADQANLVVNGAEEILLRSFSGDPNRILYKNRIPKNSPTNKIFIEESKLAGAPLFDGGQLLHAPNILWSAVNDEDFEVSYGYFPVTVYVKEDTSSEFGKKAFVLSKTPAVGFVPLNAEIYSTYTNMFIGIGEGRNYSVALTDTRLTYSVGFAPVDGKAKTTVTGDSITFKQKVSNFALEYEASNAGAQIDVFINGVLKGTIETLDSNLVSPEVRKYEVGGLDHEVETEVKFVHSGSDSGILSPSMTIVGIHFDALSKDMNNLIKEFKNFEVDFLTPATYNTTPMGPYTVQLPNFPVKDGSIVVSYNDVVFKEVATEGELTDTTFMIDDMRGLVRFNRALTGVMATYSITGGIYDSELVSTMNPGSITYTTPTENQVTNASIGTGDGVNRTFNLAHSNIKEGSVVVKVAGSVVAIESVDYVNKKVTLVTAPANGTAVTADYIYITNPTTTVASNKYPTEFAIKAGTVKVFDQNGVELTLAAQASEFGNGKFIIDANDDKIIHLAKKDANGVDITKVEVVYSSDERPGVPTNYTRAIIEKPKSINEYPWFELDKGSVRFVAEFPELKPSHNITIREMGLFDGPRADDKVAGFRNYPVKAFSLVRVGETRKDVNTGIRITWTITLLNDQGQPFQGGRN